MLGKRIEVVDSARSSFRVLDDIKNARLANGILHRAISSAPLFSANTIGRIVPIEPQPLTHVHVHVPPQGPNGLDFGAVINAALHCPARQAYQPTMLRLHGLKVSVKTIHTCIQSAAVWGPI